MRVLAKWNNWRNCPALAAKMLYPSNGEYRWIKVGAEYDVHAVSVSDGIVEFQIISSEWPFFYPAALFEVIEGGLPSDWICRTFNNGRLQMVIGPEFMAKDVESYSATLEMNPPQSDLFWERIRRIEAQQPKGNATVLLDSWMQCPLCEEAWEERIREAIVKCPKCNSVLHNPLYSTG